MPYNAYKLIYIPKKPLRFRSDESVIYVYVLLY